MSTTHFETLINIINSNSRIIKKLERHLGPLHGLGLNEFLALYHLQRSPHALSRIILADLLGLSASGVTRLLNPMEKLGLIERQVNGRDARLSLVKLTKAGALKFKDSSVSAGEAITDVFINVTKDEKDSLLSIISRIN
jgi:DNA-binding MarR family transcriptional regulator